MATTYSRPGVYIQESLTALEPTVGSNSATVAAFIGANNRGPTTPTLVRSWNEYVKYFGSWNGDNKLPIAVKLYFDNGGNQAYVQRVTGSTTSTATVTAASATGGTVTYTAANGFTAGQNVTITNLSTSAFNLAGVVIASATSTQFTVTNAATGTAVTGATATAVAGYVATVTAASATAGTITYTAANGFTAGQIVTIAGLSTSAFNLVNAQIATATSTQFTITSGATGTAVTGATATATVGAPVAATQTFLDSGSTAYLTLTALNPGTWGNSVYATITASTLAGYWNLTIYQGGTTSANIVNNYTDLSFTNATDARYAVSIINADPYRTVNATAGTSTLGPTSGSLPSLVAFAYGNDGTFGATESTIVSTISNYDYIRESLVLNVPGVTSSTNVNTLITYADSTLGGRGDVFVVVDPIADTVANQLALATAYTPSSYAAVYYPQVIIADPTVTTPGVLRTVGGGGAIVGMYAVTDISRGVFKAPAGIETRLADVVSILALTSANLDNMNTAVAPVNPIRYMPGSGFVVMGARTLKGTYVDRYIPVRRTLIYLEKALKDLTQYAVFEPNDAVLWRSLTSVTAGFLTNFWASGGLRGDYPADAFFVKCDSELNTLSSIDAGIVNIQVGLSLQRPAEFIVINIGQYNGGTTVTVTA
jgi:hypothetical protein